MDMVTARHGGVETGLCEGVVVLNSTSEVAWDTFRPWMSAEVYAASSLSSPDKDEWLWLWTSPAYRSAASRFAAISLIRFRASFGRIVVSDEIDIAQVAVLVERPKMSPCGECPPSISSHVPPTPPIIQEMNQ